MRLPRLELQLPGPAHPSVHVLHLLWVFNLVTPTVIHACSPYCR